MNSLIVWIPLLSKLHLVLIAMTATALDRYSQTGGWVVLACGDRPQLLQNGTHKVTTDHKKRETSRTSAARSVSSSLASSGGRRSTSGPSPSSSSSSRNAASSGLYTSSVGSLGGCDASAARGVRVEEKFRRRWTCTESDGTARV